MRTCLVVILLVVTSARAHAQAPGAIDATPQPTVDLGRDTHRLTVGLAAVMYASYPMSFEDPAPALMIGKPLWLGTRHRFFQWALDGNVLAGFGTASKHAHLAVAPRFGLNVYFGSVVGLEFRMGVAGVLQAGSRTVAGFGLSGSGGYVFRFWDDDRRRLKLVMVMHAGGYLADDPGNDMGMNASALGVGMAYETPI